MSKPDFPVVILHRPSLGENIGAVARAMSNFGLQDLRLVQARKGWDKTRANNAARAGAPVLAARREYAHLSDALVDVDYMVASTARRRDMIKPVLSPAKMGDVLRAHIADGRRVAILFGSEKAGLDNDAIALADAIVHIPACANASSLNLAQAVVLLSYAWFCAVPHPMPPKALPVAGASKGELQNFFAHLEAALDAAAFLRPKEKKPAMLRGLKNIFVRAQLNAQELRSLRGVLNALLLWPHNKARSAQAQTQRATIRKLSTPAKD